MKKSYSSQAMRTKSFLKKAFIQMVHKKGFRTVILKDIVEYVQYNRTTFYVYYQNIDDLVNELMEEMDEAIRYYSMYKYKRNSRIKVSELTTSSFDLLFYIYDQRDYFKLLFLEDTLPHIHQQLPEALFHVLENNFDIQYNVPVVDDHFQKRYMAYGTAGVIVNWIAQDFNVSPSDMTKHLIRIFHTFSRGFVIKENGNKFQGALD